MQITLPKVSVKAIMSQKKTGNIIKEKTPVDPCDCHAISDGINDNYSGLFEGKTIIAAVNVVSFQTEVLKNNCFKGPFKSNAFCESKPVRLSK